MENTAASKRAGLSSVDLAWKSIREAAETAAAAEPLLAGKLHADDFESEMRKLALCSARQTH